MHKVMVVGAGKIGSLMACLFNQASDYQVYLVDQQFTGAKIERLLQEQTTIEALPLDVRQQKAVIEIIEQRQIQAIVSCLPYYVNVDMARIAKACGIAYFDLTEDIEVTQTIRQLADGATQVFAHRGDFPAAQNSTIDVCSHIAGAMGNAARLQALLCQLHAAGDGVNERRRIREFVHRHIGASARDGA